MVGEFQSSNSPSPNVALERNEVPIKSNGVSSAYKVKSNCGMMKKTSQGEVAKRDMIYHGLFEYFV